MSRTSPQSARRGFALPLMVIFTLVVGIVAASMLERQAADRRQFERQLDGYQRHHLGRGMQEVVGAWIQNLGNADNGEIVDVDGRAFTLRLGDGTTIEVSLEEAQDTVLVNFDQLSAADREDAIAIVGHLGPLAPEEKDLLTRPFGPLEVAVNGADERVLHAIASALVADPDMASTVAEEVIAARSERRIERSDVIQAAIRAGLSNEERLRLAAVMAEETALWKLTADVRPSQERRRIVRSRGGERLQLRRFEGHVLIGRAGRRGSIGDWDNPGPFLSWVEVDPRESLRRQAAETEQRQRGSRR